MMGSTSYVENDGQYVLDGTIKPTNLIQKSKPLAKLDTLNMFQFKLLDIYLSRINTHNPEKRTVTFNRGELEALFGVSRIRNEVLADSLLGLMRAMVQLNSIKEDGTINNDDFIMLNLFSCARCTRDEVSGKWKVELTCSDAAMQYIFNIEQIGYLKYKLQNVIRMKNKYSYTLYLWLLDSFNFKKVGSTVTASLDELHKVLGCENYFPEFREFNRSVLKPCYKEILQQTNLNFEYKYLKNGKAVEGIEFKFLSSENEFVVGNVSDDNIKEIAVETKTNAETGKTEVEIMTEQFEKSAAEERRLAIIQLSAACNHEFSDAELALLYETLINPQYCQQENIFNYFRQQYLQMNIVGEKQIIHNRFAYLRTMIENAC